MDTSPTPFERAIADEVVAEKDRQRLMHKELQALSGVKQRAYSYYFIEQIRHIPMPAIEKVAKALGLRPSELLARAEATSENQARPSASLAEHIERQLSPEAQAEVRRARESLTERPGEARPNG